jgi:succinate dehydrogenase / fumarate reductase cytochrome b subunit
MSWFTDLYRSAVGKKAVMAVTGIILFGFVLGHMIGNLKLYEPGTYQGALCQEDPYLRPLCASARAAGAAGVPYIDAYGAFLRQVGVPALAVLLHIWAAWQVTRLSQVARPHEYASRPKRHTSYASRTMRWGGIIILLFVIYHLLDFTAGKLNPGFVKGDVYRNVVASFSLWYVALFYIVAQVALGFHLYHGLWSLFQSLGWTSPRFNQWRSTFAHAFAWIITIGNVSFPLAVLSHLIH